MIEIAKANIRTSSVVLILVIGSADSIVDFGRRWRCGVGDGVD